MSTLSFPSHASVLTCADRSGVCLHAARLALDIGAAHLRAGAEGKPSDVACAHALRGFLNVALEPCSRCAAFAGRGRWLFPRRGESCASSDGAARFIVACVLTEGCRHREDALVVVLMARWRASSTTSAIFRRCVCAEDLWMYRLRQDL